MYEKRITYKREKKQVSTEKRVQCEEEDSFLWANISYVLDEVLGAAAARMYHQMSGSNSLCVTCKEGILSGSIFREP